MLQAAQASLNELIAVRIVNFGTHEELHPKTSKSLVTNYCEKERTNMRTNKETETLKKKVRDEIHIVRF